MIRKDAKLAQEARTAFETWRQYFKQNIDKYHLNMNFVLGKQWNDQEEDMLKSFKKVPLQFNMLATLVNSLLGEQQQNTPQLDVFPLSNCDEETASIRQMIVKDLILSSQAKTTYQVVAMQAAVGSFSAFCLDTEYENEEDFDVTPCYRYFKDPCRVYFDISAERIDKTDGLYAGYTYRMTREQCIARFGEDVTKDIFGDLMPYAPKEEVALAVQPGLTEDPFSWADANGVTTLRHFKRTHVKQTIYKLSNGEVLNQEQMDELVNKSQGIKEQLQMQEDLLGDMSGLMDEQENPFEEINEETDDRVTLFYEGEPVSIIDSREIKKSKITQYEIAGDYILEKTVMPCDDLPVIFADQNSYYEKTGKQICRSVIDDAIDAQRYINYLGTQSAYILKISRYDQFMGSKKNVASNDTQRNWRDPTSVKGMITYDESPSGAKPEQIRPPELSSSLSEQFNRAVEDIYRCTGMYPTRLGQQGNEISGAAIDARTRQGSYQTYVFFNSINRAIESGGKILNQMIPRVYDSERIITLRNTDEGRKNIVVNKQMDEYGEVIQNDLRKGTFCVELKPGASYEGQKEMALESLKFLLQADPTLFTKIADLYAENLPLANTLEIKNRLKTMVPPEIVEAGRTGKIPAEMGQQQPTPEQQQAAAEQQAVQAEVQYKQAQIQLKVKELQLKERQMQADIEIERMKLEIAQMELAGNVEEQRMRYLAETDRTQSDNAIAHADNLVKILTSQASHI